MTEGYLYRILWHQTFVLGPWWSRDCYRLLTLCNFKRICLFQLCLSTEGNFFVLLVKEESAPLVHQSDSLGARLPLTVVRLDVVEARLVHPNHEHVGQKQVRQGASHLATLGIEL